MNHLSNSIFLEDVEVPERSLYLAELTRRIDTLTQRQVGNLRVIQVNHKLILTGCSRSYYVKQLASQAVMDLVPGVAVENSIDVLNQFG